MNNMTAPDELLNINTSITASPVVRLATNGRIINTQQGEEPVGGPGGFSIYLDAAVQYESLSQIADGIMAGMRIPLSEGLFAQHVVIKSISVSGNPHGDLLLKADFSGSFAGTLFLTGKPVYDASNKTLVIQKPDYDLQTKNLLLKGAKWLFAGKIETALRKASRFDLRSYLQVAQQKAETYINREWAKGVTGTGSISELAIVSAEALPQHLLIKAACVGYLQISIAEIKLNFQP